MYPLKLLVALFLSSTFLFVACKKPTPNSDYLSKADCTVLIDSLNTYNNSIKAIFNSYCAYSPCHDASTAKKSVVLDSYESSVAAVNKYSTKFLCSINQDKGTVAMPNKLPRLNDSLILKITCWIKNGMQE